MITHRAAVVHPGLAAVRRIKAVSHAVSLLTSCLIIVHLIDANCTADDPRRSPIQQQSTSKAFALLFTLTVWAAGVCCYLAAASCGKCGELPHLTFACMGPLAVNTQSNGRNENQRESEHKYIKMLACKLSPPSFELGDQACYHQQTGALHTISV
jgi:hypothetical protein